MGHSIFPNISAKNQRKLQDLLLLMAEIKALGGTVKAIRYVAKKSGKSERTLYRHWIAWKKEERFELLLDKRSFNQNREFRPQVGVLPPEFVEFWRMLVEQNQRKAKPARRKLLRMLEDWRNGKIKGIQGYDSPPPNKTGSDAPHGWSYRNLVRLQPTETQLLAARRGRAAARAKTPLVRTTRLNMEPGLEYQFDDMWLDVMALGPNRKPCRLLTFGAVDYYSDFSFQRGVKPRMEAEDGKHKMLNKHDFLFYLACVLSTHGYHPQGTKLVVEHGTAAIPQEVEALLNSVSRGKLQVSRSGLGGAPALPGRGREKGGGNPRFKALIESMGNLIHNELADLPGQTGRNRDEKPQSIHGDLQESNQLARIEQQRGIRLRHPFKTYQEVIAILCKVTELLNDRTDHQLEGFDHSSLQVQEVLFGDVWESIDSLTGDAKEFALKVVKENPARFRSRKKSPREVWKQRRRLTKLHPTILPAMLGEEFGKLLTVRNGLFRLNNVHYLANAVSSAGIPQYLNNGGDYLCYVNPFAPNQLIVADTKNRAIGVCQIHGRVDRMDTQAVVRQHARNEAIFAESIAPAVQRSAGKVQEVRERHKFNARAIKESGALTKKRKISSEEPKVSSDILLEND